MKKRILIHIGSLSAGGAEKSLISLLNTIPEDKYEIDLMLIKKSGLFFNQIPSYINILDAPVPYNCIGISLKNIGYYLTHKPKYLIRKLYSFYKLKTRRVLSMDQVQWSVWKGAIPVLEKEYDVALSYLEGVTNYYILEKVKARRKLIWIHNEYSKLGYCNKYDTEYFGKADAVVTISELCRNNIIENFPFLAKKVFILENITNPSLVLNMADANIEDSLFENSKEIFKILSIGRFAPQKNFSMAIDTAKILKDKGVRFKWYIIGDGPLKDEFKTKISNLGLEDYVILLGIRSNPYPYIKQCDIFVQPSLYEGKSIVLDEAKILCKPIVATCYTTVYNSITNGINGIISEMNSESLAENIYRLYLNPDERNRYSQFLSENVTSNVSEINNYYKLLD